MKKLRINHDATESIAQELSLTTIETTIGNNGYPEALKYGLIDINQYSDIEEIQRRYPECEIIPFLAYKKDGWQLYERRQVGEIYEPLYILDFYSDADNFEFWTNETNDDTIMREYKESLDAFDTLEEANNLLNKYNNILSIVENLDDDEVLITQYLEEVDVFEKQIMKVSNIDSQTFAIGVFVVDKEE